MKLKTYLLILFFLTLRAYASATIIKFGGRVIDAQTSEGLPGATVSIPDLRLSVTTDDKGEFSFNRISSKGQVLVEVTFIGYETLTQVIDLGSTTSFDFTLSPSVIETKEVVVMGTAFSSDSKKNSTSLHIVSKEELTTKPTNNIIDAIAHVPGVSQITTGNAISKPVIRGLSHNRIVTIANGVKQQGNQFGDEHGIEIDQFSASRIEILRGAASLLYGSDALGGVINIINPIPVPDAEGRAHAEFRSNYNTNNGLTANSLMLFENRNGFVYRAHGTYKSAYSYQTPSGYFPNSVYDEFDLDGQAGLNRSWGYVHLDASTYRSHIGFYNPMIDANGNFVDKSGAVFSESQLKSRSIGVPNQDVRHYKIALNSNLQLGSGKLKSTFGYQRNIRREIADPLSIPDLFLELNTYSYDLKYYFQEKQGWEPVFGTAGQFQKADNTSIRGTNVVIPSYDSNEFGVFAYLKKSWLNTTINGGIRWDYRSIDGEEYKDRAGVLKYPAMTNTFHNLSGALGLTQEFTKYLSLKINTGTAFRAPIIAELGSDGVHEGLFRYEIGNSKLTPERSYQLDGSVAYESNYFEINLGGFFNYIDDYIYSSNVIGETKVVGATTYPVYRYTQDNASLWGLEAAFTFHPLKYLHLENTFSYIHAENRTLGRPLPLIPAGNVKNELKFEPNIKGLNKSYLSIGIDNFFNQNRVDDTFETPTSGYSLINMGIGTTIRLKRQQLSLYIVAKNITDKKYYDHLSRLKPGRLDPTQPFLGAYNPGRNIIFGIFMPLSIRRW